MRNSTIGHLHKVYISIHNRKTRKGTYGKIKMKILIRYVPNFVDYDEGSDDVVPFVEGIELKSQTSWLQRWADCPLTPRTDSYSKCMFIMAKIKDGREFVVGFIKEYEDLTNYERNRLKI